MSRESRLCRDLRLFCISIALHQKSHLAKLVLSKNEHFGLIDPNIL